jgi:hypothetical protein
MTDTRTTEPKRDIVDRLRWTWADHGQGYNSEYTKDLMEAADEIERLRELVAERAADETPALPTAAETACWHGPGFVCPLCHPVLSVMPDSAADTSSAGQGASDEATAAL